MISRTVIFLCLRGAPLAAVWLLLVALPASAQETFPSAPEIITNLVQVSVPVPTNFPSRRQVAIHLRGTVEIGGNFGGVARLDGSPAFFLLPPDASGFRLERGRRIQIDGNCLIEGTNLMLDSRPLIENDGLHSSNGRSAGLWLDAGKVPLRVQYFNNIGDRALKVSIAGPGMPRRQIPVEMLGHGETNPLTGVITWTSGLTFQCYTGMWNSLPDFAILPRAGAGVTPDFDIGVSGRQDYFGLQFDGCVAIPRTGFYTFSCLSDDGSTLAIGRQGISIEPGLKLDLPALPRLGAGQLIGPEIDQFCGTLDGLVTQAVRDAGGLSLELSSGTGRATVRVISKNALEPQWLIGAHVSADGICQSVYTPEGYKVGGKLTISSEEHLRVLEVPRRFWDSPAAVNLRRAGGRLPATVLPALVRLHGVLVTNAETGLTGIQNDSGVVDLDTFDTSKVGVGAPVEALGLVAALKSNLTMYCYALRETPPVGGDKPGELPLLTTVEAVKQMSRDEAKLGYPVKVRGVVTFVWPAAGFFLQDATWSIDVRMATNAAVSMPEIGEYWEVEGETFAAFAPDILAKHAVRLGAGAMPDPVHPNSTQLADGSLDAQYIEVQGVVLSAAGAALFLLTRDGQIKVQLPEILDGSLAKLQGALVRVRGCLIPGRDVKTQQVKLGEFELRNASVAVDEPAPENPFALPLIHAADLLLFDSHASPIQRARIQGVVLQQRDGVTFLMDRLRGVRVVSEADETFAPGDLVETVGFPDLSGPSPVFNHALIRRFGHQTLPEAMPLTADKLLDGQYDSTRVEIQGVLVSQRSRGADQILEMRSGPRLWLARLPLRASVLPEYALGSLLKLTGVYAGQGGDRTHGRDIDSFELLLSSARDVVVLHSPPWWTARRALGVAVALLAILLLAAVWIRALHLQVEERTRALKSEIEDHKRTELELEEKTRMLTREIEERLRIEAEVERGHKQLLLTSRLAGMAEVATSVLHNVGNVMTSVNVLSSSIVDLVRNSKITSVARLGELLGKNRRDLDRFLTEDERGRKMPDYVGHLGAHLADEQSLLLHKVKVLNENIHHINEIVAMQQNYAKVSGVSETVPPEEVVEDALRMHGESLKRHGIKLIRDYERIPAVTMDRHKVLQILFNLLENAKYACLQGGTPDKKIAVILHSTATGFVSLSVSDNGVGIPAENLARIFGQGFSTRKDGHGFGLHSSILAAQDMGGGLTARSEGPGRGAVFTLEIPLARRRVAPPPRT